MKEQSNTHKGQTRSKGDWEYNPVPDDYRYYDPTTPRVMVDEETGKVVGSYVVVGTPRVGVDGLREALIKLHGAKDNPLPQNQEASNLPPEAPELG